MSPRSRSRRAPAYTTEHGHLQVDLKVSSSSALEAAIEKIKGELTARTNVDIEKLTDLLTHVEAELEANAPVPVSLEHLELYHAWLDRQKIEPGFRAGADDAKDNTELGPDLAERVSDLKATVESMLREHPLQGVPRSVSRLLFL